MMACASNACTTSSPEWTWSSKPQKESCSFRRSSGATGQPGRHDEGRSAAVTRTEVPLKGGPPGAGWVAVVVDASLVAVVVGRAAVVTGTVVRAGRVVAGAVVAGSGVAGGGSAAGGPGEPQAVMSRTRQAAARHGVRRLHTTS